METITLKRGEVKSLSLGSGAQIRCNGGLLWLTFEGENADVLLRHSESWAAPRRGKAVVQALEKGSFCQSGKLRSASSREWFHWPKPLILKL